ncbi:ribosomal protein S5 domain 2-type protein [Chytridium lagenaria]|nr:ribosomal protein S5 domain 2-type protein [Chytridium lagenaria]
MEPSKNEKDFVYQALQDGIRWDGRKLLDYRNVKIIFGPDYGRVEALLGKTRVLANVSAEIERPLANNPNEGFVTFTTSFSPMASPTFETGRPSEEEVLVSRLLEKALKRTRAIDTEGLCIISGEKVWSIRIDIHVLDHEGNILDCACIAAVTALLHFRRPDISVDGDVVTVRNPIPLSVHHIPICITFGLFDDGERVIMDPSHLEEQVQEGDMTIVVNAHRELCTLSKAGGCPLEMSLILRCSNVAAVKAAEITELIRTVVSKANEKTK